MPTDVEGTYITCQLYLSSKEASLDWISQLLDLDGRGFSKGDSAQIGGMQVERAYSMWSYETFTEEEVPDALVADMLRMVAANIRNFREIVKRTGEKFRVRIHCDGTVRDQVFSLSVPVSELGKCNEIICEFEVVVR